METSGKTPPRFLVVDDDPALLYMMSKMMKKWGYEIATAADGEEGLALARQNRFDLVILDLMMPRKDGWEVLRELRGFPGYEMTPVMFVTSMGSDKHRIKSLKLGADDYLIKPFHFKELKLRIDNILKRQEASASWRQSRGVPGGSLHGTLDQMGLPSLLMSMEMEGKTGILNVENSETQERGYIFMNDGRIIRARLNRPGPKNEELIYYLLTWPTGRFELKSLDVQMPAEMNVPVTSLLLEGARRHDETGRFQEQGVREDRERRVKLDSELEEVVPDILSSLKGCLEELRRSLETGDYEAMSNLAVGLVEHAATCGLQEACELGHKLEHAAHKQDREASSHCLDQLAQCLSQMEISYS
jgi:DNA-binding response OmpR family regulator/HPt (histidine-containing phosphotransfer) domain-containing protein